MMMIAIARIINIRSGGAVISPWQVDELDDDWINAFMTDIPEMIAEHNQKVDAARREFLAKNKVM